MKSRRERILDAVKDAPGCTASAILEKAGLHTRGSPRMLLNMMESEGLLRIERINHSYTRVYPAKKRGSNRG